MINLIESLFKLLIRFFFFILFTFTGKPTTNQTLRKASDLYGDDQFSQLFTQVRIWDAPYQELEDLLPKKGTIIDLGCGDGFLANYLALAASERKIIGIEINKNRLKLANKGIKNARFILGDITKIKFPKADVILLVHVLHHLGSLKAQEELIKFCSKKLPKKGELIIVEIDRKPLIKYFFTYLIDTVLVPILFDKKFIDTHIKYRRLNQWIELLRNNGFSSKVRLAHKGKPFSNVLIISKK
jgi:SAM-dependent methyltransferase